MTQSIIGALRVVLGIDSTSFDNGLTAAQSRLKNTGADMQKLGGQIAKVGAGLSVAVTAPLVALGSQGVQAAKQFQAAMSNVSTLVDTASESIEDMGRAVLGVARRTPVEIDELTQALYNIRSAGIAAADSMNVLEGSAKLAVAGLGTTEQAADLVTSAINAFRLEGEEQLKVYDTIFKAVKNGKTTIAQLAQGFGSVAGTVASANISLEDFLAATAALTTTGVPAAQAYTQIRAAIVGLTRETRESAAVFSSLGVNTFKELVEQSGSLGVAFQKIVEATDNNDARLIKLLGSVEAYNAVVGIAKGVNDAYSATLDDMANGQNAVNEAFEKQSATSASKDLEMRNRRTAALIALGNALLPITTMLTEKITFLFEAFNSLDEGTQKVVVGIGLLVAAIGPVTVGIGGIVSAAGAMLPLLIKIGPAFVAIGTAITATVIPALAAVGRAILAMLVASGPIGWLALAITGIVTVWMNWDKIEPVVRRLYEAVKTWIRERLGAVFDWLGRKVEQVGDFFARLYDRVVGNSYVPDMVDGIADEVARLDGVFVKPIQAGVEDVADSFASLDARLADGFANTFTDMVTGVQSVGDAMRNLIRDLSRELVQMFVATPLKNFLSQGLNSAFAGFFADGGTIPRGTWGVVGERGPELAYAGAGGTRVQPLDRGGATAMAGGGVTIHFHGPVSNAEQVRRSAAQAGAALLRMQAAGKRGV